MVSLVRTERNWLDNKITNAVSAVLNVAILETKFSN